MPLNLDECKVCSVCPTGVSENAAFIVDIDQVHFDDIKSDELGSWKATGTKSSFFTAASTGVKFLKKKPSRHSKYNVLIRRYYVHGTYPLFHRMIADIQG